MMSRVQANFTPREARDTATMATPMMMNIQKESIMKCGQKEAPLSTKR